MWKYTNTDELYHYGILGMRWGVRRSRYTSKDYRQAKNISKKKVNQMSNKELSIVNKRMDLENRYSDLKSKKSIGKKLISAFTTGATTVTAAVGAYEVYKKYGGKGKKAVAKIMSNIGKVKG